ncbi:YfcE family phosphodiesterase [Candidatus Gottesmanbacteria bacterium]|nr:YfcE family phosphodiesterase [Candidatus Gottesmanbacteria bacterium]
MKIALISDIHDNEHNLREAIKVIKENNINEIIALGDYCYPGIIRYFISTGLKFRGIFGNNDGDRAGMMQDAMKNNGQVVLARGEFDEYEIDSSKIFVTHYPQIAEEMASSGKYNVVFYGHDHIFRSEKLANGCLIFNPGEISGLKTGAVSLGIWDSVSHEGSKIEIQNPLLTNK